MKRGIIAGAVLCALAAPAAADSLVEPDDIPAQLSLTKRIEANLSLMSLELNTHLSRLSLNLMEMRFDVTGRRAKFRLGTEGEDFGLKLDTDIKFQGGYARLATRIDLKVAGKALSFDLPEVDYVPKSVDGDFIVRVPIIKGTF